MSSRTPEAVAAQATGIGIGLLALMLTWLIANRVASLAWRAPAGPTVAFLGAIAVGIVTALVAGRRLARSVDAPERLENPAR